MTSKVERIRSHSRATYCRPRVEVEAEIILRQQLQQPLPKVADAPPKPALKPAPPSNLPRRFIPADQDV